MLQQNALHDSNTKSNPPAQIPHHFGDIMTKRNTSLTLPEGFSGFERIILSANGNLQRLISAFFNSPVTVDIVDNTQMPLTEMDLLEHPTAMARFVREVNLLCNEKIFCNAKSHVLITDQKVYDLVVKDRVAIGQIFKYLDRLPSFELHGTGRTEKAFWREYSLKCPGVDCRLLEVFSRNLGDDNWICTPQDTIDWKVEMTSPDKITWVNRS